MHRKNILHLTGSALVVGVALFTGDARSDGTTAPRQVTPNSDGHGFASVYGNIPADQAEALSSSDAIKAAAATAPASVIWSTLEHGETVECLDCIPAVSPLLYDANPRTREIAAWWLRRRMFGVFGSGEVYSQVLSTLQTDANPVRRADAANALGEFLAVPGIAACAQAVTADSDAGVRAAAASALGRLNSDGTGALGQALTDSDEGVKLAALGAATRINTFSGLANAVRLTLDPSALVRRRTAQVLDALDAKDSVAAVAAMAQNDSDPRVRAAACHALGTFGDASAQPVLQNLAANDPDTFVRDQAAIALQAL